MFVPKSYRCGGEQDHITAKDPCLPQCFLYLSETKIYRCGEGEEEEGEKISLKTHATARGMGKKEYKSLTSHHNVAESVVHETEEGLSK